VFGERINGERQAGEISMQRRSVMKGSKARIFHAPGCWWYSTITLVGCFVFSVAVAGQNLPTGVSSSVPQLPATVGVRLKGQLSPVYEGKAGNPKQGNASPTATPRAASSEPVTTQSGVRLITLENAQEKAAPADNPMVRLGQLQVEVARQTRLGTKSSFFPQIGSTFENLHFNKFMGQLLEIHRPIQGGTTTVGLPLLGKDQTLVAVTATQPITPLFQLRELYKINLADERIARAKAGMPVSETASKVEKSYYELLVAQRQLDFVKVKATETANKWLVASSSTMPVASGSHDEDLIEASNAVAIATTRVKELTASLNDMLGWPPDTELQLVPPDPRFEDISLRETTDKALAANPEVIEAEQNVVKARAASTLQKLAYVPVVAAMGGYAYNSDVLPLLPRDFSFIGLVATYNLFDFGKREHTIKGANAQAEMAEIALQLTKAKVAASVKNSHFELERSRQLSELTRRLDSAIQVQRASYDENSAEIIAAKKAKVEAEMFQADLDYRQALARLKTLMGER
jgi:outer membrane protein TolC